MNIERDMSGQAAGEYDREASENRPDRLEIAGGVHDLKNILTAIKCYAEMIYSELPEGSKARGMAEEILKKSEEMTRAAVQILAMGQEAHAVASTAENWETKARKEMVNFSDFAEKGCILSSELMAELEKDGTSRMI